MTETSANAIRVTHFGNSPQDSGGIASVLANYVEQPLPGTVPSCVPTYDTSSPIRTWARFLRASAMLVLRPRRRTGVAHVHVSQRGSLVREGSLVLLCRLRRLPVVVTVHGSQILESSRAFRLTTAITLRHAQCVTVLSQSVGDHLRALGIPRVQVVPNRVPVPDVRRDARSPLVVFAGELSQRKGVDVLLDAWRVVQRRVPEARLALMGHEADIDVSGLLDREDSSTVDAVGPQDRGVVRQTLESARVAVLPSRNEGMPMFLLEAMAAGCGIVATPVGGIPELIVPDEEGTAPGELVPAGDSRALAAALILALDPAISQQRGRAAHNRARQAFSNDVVGSRMVQIWHEATAEGRDDHLASNALHT